MENNQNLSQSLSDYRKILATEPGTEPNCPWCGVPRVRRSDYVRCNPCGVNWLDSEMHLPNYLNRNPAAARMVSSAKRPAETTEVGASAA